MPRIARVLLAAAACAGALTACSESHTSDGDAGGIVFDLDGAMLDGGVDAPFTPPAVGRACTADADCDGAGAVCLSDPQFLPGGYCTLSCAANPDACPDGSTCLQIGMGQAFCFQDCEPGAMPRQCRQGYGCASDFMIFPAPVCVGGCTDATDCAAGQECDPSGGFGGSGQCFLPGASLGDACADSSTCPAGGTCVDEPNSGWPGGACVGGGCDPASLTGCGAGETCVPQGRFAFCAQSCASDGDCRGGYRCTSNGGGGSYCGPGCAGTADCTTPGYVCNAALGTCDEPFSASLLGQPCSFRDPSTCAGGTCLSEGTYGFPGAYCSYVGCDLGVSGSCPAGGVCAPGATQNFCLDGCTTDADCRTGYACRPSNAADATSPLACMPACAADSECANVMRGFTCNLGTGLCRPAFDVALLGEPCTGGAECMGGRCRTEATDGWPAGTCAYPGCRLSGTGPAATCPAGSTCADDGLGDPTLGECLTSCTVGAATGCRPGYACVAADGGMSGVCRPACSDATCSAGRACDPMTGLCR